MTLNEGRDISPGDTRTCQNLIIAAAIALNEGRDISP